MYVCWGVYADVLAVAERLVWACGPMVTVAVRGQAVRAVSRARSAGTCCRGACCVRGRLMLVAAVRCLRMLAAAARGACDARSRA